MKRYLQAPILTLLLCWAWASAAAGAAAPPEEVVRNTTDTVLSHVKADREHLKKDAKAMHSLADALIMPHFDFDRMSRWVLGRHWNETDPATQQTFKDEFRTLLIRTYAKAILEYSDEAISYTPSEPSGDEAEVRTSVARSGGGTPISINYFMHLSGGAWKVIDITVDGVALVSTYRSSFSSEIEKKGINGLIASLQAKNAGANQ